MCTNAVLPEGTDFELTHKPSRGAIMVAFAPTERLDLMRQLTAHHCIPRRLQTDNGSEFISKALKALDRWAYEYGVTIDFSRSGRPTDNPYIESFNGSFRDECLNTH